MKISIEKRIEIQVDKSLKYPMIFVESERKDKAFLDAVKSNLFNIFAEKFSANLSDREDANAFKAKKECVLIADWIDKGYLCFPAYMWGFNDQPFNCGPHFNKCICASISFVSNDYCQMFEQYCTAVAHELRGKDSDCAMLRQLLGLTKAFEVVIKRLPSVIFCSRENPAIFLCLEDLKEIEQVQVGMNKFIVATIGRDYRTHAWCERLSMELGHGLIQISVETPWGNTYDSMVLSCLSVENQMRVQYLREIEMKLTEAWRKDGSNFTTRTMEVEFFHPVAQFFAKADSSLNGNPAEREAPIPNFKVGHTVFLNMDSLIDADLNTDGLLWWVVQKAPKYQSRRYTVQEIKKNNNLFFYRLDGILFDTWVPEQFLKA